jgi:hypothetical protein
MRPGQAILVTPLECVHGRITALVSAVRRLYYALVLWQCACTRCGSESLIMIAEGRCRCTACSVVFDPTDAFVRCPRCQAKPRRRFSRYQCTGCGRDVASPFLFDGKIFDAAYFRERMRASRKRRAQQKPLAVGPAAAATSHRVGLGAGRPDCQPRPSSKLWRY